MKYPASLRTGLAYAKRGVHGDWTSVAEGGGRAGARNKN